MCSFEGIIRKRKRHSSIAQSVEHAAVNRAVVGSSPTRGAGLKGPQGFGPLAQLVRATGS